MFNAYTRQQKEYTVNVYHSDFKVFVICLVEELWASELDPYSTEVNRIYQELGLVPPDYYDYTGTAMIDFKNQLIFIWYPHDPKIETVDDENG